MSLLQDNNYMYFFFDKKLMMVSVITMVLCFAVGCGCYSTVIQPCGPRMCEQITKMSGTITYIYEADNLTCKLQTGERAKEKCKRGQIEGRQIMQMRCVMCTDVPLKTETKRCQGLDGYTVCAFIKDNRSCVFTSKMPREDQEINYSHHCGMESGLTRLQRQMSCVLLSRLVKTKGFIIQEENLWMKHVEPGANVSMQCSTIYESTRKVNSTCSPNLLQSLRRGDLLKFQILLRNRSRDIECRNNVTAMMNTAMLGRVSMFNMLLGLGGNISAVDTDMNTVLHYACNYDKRPIVTFLIDLGCDVDKKGEGGRTPLLLATERGHIRLSKYLLSKGCDVSAVDVKGNSILHVICETNYQSFLIAIWKVMGSIDLEGRNDDDETPLLRCAHHKATAAMVMFLHEKGCSMTAVNPVTGNTILHEAVSRHKDYSYPLVEYVIQQKKIKLDSTNKIGETPLALAQLFSHPDAVKYLKKQVKAK